MSSKSPKLSAATSSCSLSWVLFGQQKPSLIHLPFCWSPTMHRLLILYFTIIILYNQFKGRPLHEYAHVWTPQPACPHKPCLILWKFLSLDNISYWRGPHAWHAVLAQEDTPEEAHTGPGLGGHITVSVFLYRLLARSWAQAVGAWPLGLTEPSPFEKGHDLMRARVEPSWYKAWDKVRSSLGVWAIRI